MQETFRLKPYYDTGVIFCRILWRLQGRPALERPQLATVMVIRANRTEHSGQLTCGRSVAALTGVVEAGTLTYT